MMEYSVPSVTLDDLRDFQARHFIVRDQDLHQGHQAEETWEKAQYYDEDDDGLGYYADGVKRTLTDEQIAIFRHSEIQRLLHERRLKAEAEADKSQQDLKTASDQDTAMADGNTGPNIEDESKKSRSHDGKDNKERPAHGCMDATRHGERSMEYVSYENSETTKPTQPRTPGTTKTTSQPFQRRLVSYDD